MTTFAPEIVELAHAVFDPSQSALLFFRLANPSFFVHDEIAFQTPFIPDFSTISMSPEINVNLCVAGWYQERLLMIRFVHALGGTFKGK
jgi:hypothetical protein